MRFLKNNHGFSILEVLVASAAAVTVGVWVSQSMVNMSRASRKLATASDARSEAKALLDTLLKEVKGRYVPTGTEPAELEWSSLSRPEPGFGNCGGATQACQKLKVRQRSSTPNIARTITFESECVQLPGASFIYMKPPAAEGAFVLPGEYVSCVVGEVPRVRISVAYESLSPVVPVPAPLLAMASTTTYPHQPHVGTFMCLRPCAAAMSVEVGVMYRTDQSHVQQYATKLSFPMDRNTNIQILPP